MSLNHATQRAKELKLSYEYMVSLYPSVPLGADGWNFLKSEMSNQGITSACMRDLLKKEAVSFVDGLPKLYRSICDQKAPFYATKDAFNPEIWKIYHEKCIESLDLIINLMEEELSKGVIQKKLEEFSKSSIQGYIEMVASIFLITVVTLVSLTLLSIGHVYSVSAGLLLGVVCANLYSITRRSHWKSYRGYVIYPVVALSYLFYRPFEIRMIEFILDIIP